MALAEAVRPTTVSLFCGAGGESLGKHLAFEELGVNVQDMRAHALNHWDLAVSAHGRNLPWIHVHQEDITAVTAATYGLERINLLWASPSCVHFSRARGGQPKEDQQRSHAWEVVDRWIRVAQVDVLLVENVPEFQDWGPLDDEGRVILDRKGEHFRSFVDDLRALGYEVEWRVLCAADYGDPTIRRRFFLQAVRDGKGIHWPEPTHRDPRKPAGLFDGELKPWRTAAECIDWSIPVPSIFDRKKPLAEATLRRIAAGVVRFVLQGRPFLVNLSHGRCLEDVDKPMNTVTAGPKGGDRALVVPSLVGVGGRAAQTAPRGGDEPMGTGTTKADTALVAASMVSLRGTSPDQLLATAKSIEEPVPTISTSGHAALCTALLKHYGGVVGQEMGQPLGTVTTVDHHSLLAASIVRTDMHKSHATCAFPMDDPLRTVTTAGGHALMAASLVKYRFNQVGQSMDEPMHTITAGGTPQRPGTGNVFGMVSASLVQMGYGEREGQAPRALDIEQPMGTIVAGGVKHGLVACSLMTNTTGHAPTSLEAPVPALTTGNHQALVAAFLQQYYTSGGTSSPVDEPMRAITTLARHGLVTVEIDGATFVIVDIGMRMLEPHELASAMSFPSWYRWVGPDGKPLSKRDRVKMIGNAVPCQLAKALIKAVVLERPGVYGLGASA